MFKFRKIEQGICVMQEIERISPTVEKAWLDSDIAFSSQTKHKMSKMAYFHFENGVYIFREGL